MDLLLDFLHIIFFFRISQSADPLFPVVFYTLISAVTPSSSLCASSTGRTTSRRNTST